MNVYIEFSDEDNDFYLHRKTAANITEDNFGHVACGMLRFAEQQAKKPGAVMKSNIELLVERLESHVEEAVQLCADQLYDEDQYFDVIKKPEREFVLDLALAVPSLGIDKVLGCFHHWLWIRRGVFTEDKIDAVMRA